MSRFMNAQAHRHHWLFNVMPDLAQLQREIQPGDGIKLLTAGRPVWVEVHRIDGERITGTVSATAPGSGMKKGKAVTVRLSHVVEHIKQHNVA